MDLLQSASWAPPAWLLLLISYLHIWKVARSPWDGANTSVYQSIVIFNCNVDDLHINSSYLKFSNVKSWVISLKSSSLNVAKTFKSFTSISTALERSCLLKCIKSHSCAIFLIISKHQQSILIKLKIVKLILKICKLTYPMPQDTFASLSQKRFSLNTDCRPL